MKSLSKSVLVAAVAGGLIAAPTAAFAAHRFTDVRDDSMYAQAVERLTAAGVIEGCTDTTYCPGDDLTRGQMALLLDRMSGNGDVAPSIDAATVMGMTAEQLRGAKGDPGAAGPVGPAGAAGAEGDAGAAGPQGDPGARGAVGAVGPAGPVGSTGASGPVGAPGETGAAGLIGATGQTGPVGPAGLNEAAQFFALSPPFNESPVAPGADVRFPLSGPSTGGGGIARAGEGTFALADIGVYRVSYQVPVSEPGQLVLTLNGAEVSYTVAGRATGTSQITATVLVQTTTPNSVLTLRNPWDSPRSLTITPFAGGTRPVSALLLIERVA